MVDVSEIQKLLGGVVERLQVLKRKANESISDELAASYICKRKLQHLQEIASADNSEAAVDQWKRVSYFKYLKLELHFYHEFKNNCHIFKMKPFWVEFCSWEKNAAIFIDFVADGFIFSLNRQLDFCM